MIDPEQPPRPSEIAADGNRMPPAAGTFDAFIRVQEDGDLNAELSDALRTLAKELADHALTNNGKAAGKLKLEIGFSLDGRVFTIKSKFKVDLPEGKRPPSVMWMTEDGRFSPSNPAQLNMFGVRDTRGPAGFRDA